MKNLIIIRHAKSSWNLPVQDRDRVLTERGIKDAIKVSLTMSNFISKKQLIWSSSAKRAQETALIFAKNISYPLENIIFKNELYTFDERQLEYNIKSCKNDVDDLILFGHNDAITNFVNKFGDIYLESVPTSGFVALQFDTNDWQKINKGITTKIIFPRDLK